MGEKRSFCPEYWHISSYYFFPFYLNYFLSACFKYNLISCTTNFSMFQIFVDILHKYSLQHKLSNSPERIFHHVFVLHCSIMLVSGSKYLKVFASLNLKRYSFNAMQWCQFCPFSPAYFFTFVKSAPRKLKTYLSILK